MLCSKCPEMERKDSNFRNAIPLGKRIAIAIYKLSSSAEYRTIANLFSVSKSTVCECVPEFCHLVVEKILEEYIIFPRTKFATEKLVSEFWDTWNFPQGCGAIDGTHIKMKPQKDNASCYINYKSFNSTILLVVVDAKYQFTYSNVGAPGRTNDSYIFRSSQLYSLLNSLVEYV